MPDRLRRSDTVSRPLQSKWSPPLPRVIGHDTPGLLVMDLHLRPMYMNDSALHILSYPDNPRTDRQMTAVQERLQIILHAEHYPCESQPPAPFASGRRCYLCRSFRLESRQYGASRRQIVALLFERDGRGQLGALVGASQRFHLSPRESQTVEHMSRGLTTKEIAQRMHVSPNTVKQFVRLIMSKMGVTTRPGILGRVFTC
jgi:DNA-binding CsgD family transcriptional regulator